MTRVIKTHHFEITQINSENQEHNTIKLSIIRLTLSA
ncbi:MAG: hypothetical protein ACJASQ_002835 [Crocinitomicaceae bacterium]|jgi:hypothetical protein